MKCLLIGLGNFEVLHENVEYLSFIFQVMNHARTSVRWYTVNVTKSIPRIIWKVI